MKQNIITMVNQYALERWLNTKHYNYLHNKTPLKDVQNVGVDTEQSALKSLCVNPVKTGEHTGSPLQNNHPKAVKGANNG